MKNQRGVTLIELMIVVAIILIIGVLAFNILGGNTSSLSGISDQDFSRLMAQENVHNATNTGYSWNGCSSEDSIHVGFTGVKNDVSVRGVICGQYGSSNGWGKGYTIRYF